MERTKKLKRLYITLSIVNFLLSFGPLFYFALDAFITTGIVLNKIVITSTMVIVIMITMLCKLKQHTPRSLPWFVLCGLWIVLDNLGKIIIIFTVTTVLDEFIVQPLRAWVKIRYTIRKESKI